MAPTLGDIGRGPFHKVILRCTAPVVVTEIIGVYDAKLGWQNLSLYLGIINGIFSNLVSHPMILKALTLRFIESYINRALPAGLAIASRFT